MESFVFVEAEVYGENATFGIRCDLPFVPADGSYVYLGCDHEGLATEEKVLRSYAVDGDAAAWVVLEPFKWDAKDDEGEQTKQDMAFWKQNFASYGFVEVGSVMPYSTGWRLDMRQRLRKR